MTLIKQKLFRLMSPVGEDGSDTGGTDNVIDEVPQDVDGQDQEAQEALENEPSETIVTIGDEPPPEEEARAPDWVRDLRKKSREDKKRIRELEEQLNASKAPTTTITVGKKPTLEENDYDSEKYESELEKWYDRKRKSDEIAARIENEQNAAKAAWQAKLDGYAKAKNELGIDDIDDAESAVMEAFNVTQQGIIIQGADNAALIVAAIGKNEAKLNELKSITDPVKFAFAIAKLEDKLKVIKRSAAPSPEKRVVSTGGKPSSSALKNEGDRLLDEAQKTGNMDKYRAWSRQQRAKSA